MFPLARSVAVPSSFFGSSTRISTLSVPCDQMVIRVTRFHSGVDTDISTEPREESPRSTRSTRSMIRRASWASGRPS